jgi:ABC-2 type transport system permease protein
LWVRTSEVIVAAMKKGVFLPSAFFRFLRQFRSSAGLAATAQLGEGLLFLFDYALRFVRVAVLLAIWRALLGGRGAVEGLTLDAVMTYTLMAGAFAQQLDPRTELHWSMWQGTLATRYLRPMDLFAQFAAEAAGRWLPGLLLFSLPLLLAAPWLGVNPWPASPAAGAVFALSLALAVAVGFALDFLFGALMVAWHLPLWAVQQLRLALTALFSGALLPLQLYPWGIGEVFGWLPFAAMASAPLRIYTGTGDPRVLLATQAVWAAVLWPLARRLWDAQRERMVSYGG